MPTTPPLPSSNQSDHAQLAARIRALALELGFQRCGISGIELGADEEHLRSWLAQGLYGSMEWMARHGDKRSRPDELIPGTLRVISVGLDYGQDDDAAWANIADGERAYVARYALGRDYHKLMRQRLQSPGRPHRRGNRAIRASRVRRFGAGAGTRAGTQRRARLDRQEHLPDRQGWRLVVFPRRDLRRHAPACRRPRQRALRDMHALHRHLPDPRDHRPIPPRRTPLHCIPHHRARRLDRRELRPLIGNRIFGCDDCQLVCPWNKFAQRTDEPDFRARNNLDQASLVELFAWNEEEFLQRTEGSAIRRSGHERWLRNIAIALGNAPTTLAVIEALRSRDDSDNAVVREHVAWALAQHASRNGSPLALDLVE
jgi:epoxyqueuosine reductase